MALGTEIGFGNVFRCKHFFKKDFFLILFILCLFVCLFVCLFCFLFLFKFLFVFVLFDFDLFLRFDFFSFFLSNE